MSKPNALWILVPVTTLGVVGSYFLWTTRRKKLIQSEIASAGVEAAIGNFAPVASIASTASPALRPSYEYLPMDALPIQPGANFEWDEFSYSAVASSKTPPIDNTLTLGQKRNILWGVTYILQPLRNAIQRSVAITGGARSAALNAAIGGSEDSQHTRGQAVDIKVDGYNSKALFDYILTLGLPFDQLIWYDEIVGSAAKPKNAGHLHISWNPNNQPRGAKLHAMRGLTNTEYAAA